MKKFYLIIAVVFVMGCGNFPYQEYKKIDISRAIPGYYDEKVADDVYDVVVMGYQNTREELFFFYLHKRAKELCGRKSIMYIEPEIETIIVTSGKAPKVNSGRGHRIKCVLAE